MNKKKKITLGIYRLSKLRLNKFITDIKMNFVNVAPTTNVTLYTK